MIIEVALYVLTLVELKAAGVPEWESEIRAQTTAESAWNPTARSPWANGSMQFVQSTYDWIAPDIGCEDVSIFDHQCNTRAGIEYMSRLLRSQGDWDLARAAYNMGPGNLRKERRACRMRLGCDEDEWADNVEAMCNRTRPGACDETRRYVRRIHIEMTDPYLRPPDIERCPALGWLYTPCPSAQWIAQRAEGAVFTDEWMHD